jgi:hypothetical protein
VPSITETLLAVAGLGGDRQLDAGDGVATVTVTVEVPGVSLFEWHQIDAAREAGHQAGVAAVRALADARVIPAASASRTSTDLGRSGAPTR